MDTVSPEVRRKNMQAIKSKDTKPEIIFRKALWNQGIKGYRIHNKKITGKPDIAFIGRKVAVFIDGCFWHGCPKCYAEPKSNIAYWRGKMKNNKKRDVRNTDALESDGWCVIRIWEHEIYQDINQCISAVALAIAKSESS